MINVWLTPIGRRAPMVTPGGSAGRAQQKDCTTNCTGDLRGHLGIHRADFGLEQEQCSQSFIDTERTRKCRPCSENCLIYIMYYHSSSVRACSVAGRQPRGANVPTELV